MLLQITLGTCLLLLSVLISALNLWVIEIVFLRGHDWLIRRPHRPKLIILVTVFCVWRLLAGMAAANGFLNFGRLTALLIEALRQVRGSQIEALELEEKPWAHSEKCDAVFG